MDIAYIFRDLLIVDEASQITESEIIGVVSLFKKFILIGDHHQLPAVVTQNPDFCKVEDVKLREVGISDLRVSLFERLFEICKKNKWHHAFDQLTAHFRMHRSIADFIRKHYEEGLEESKERQKNQDYFSVFDMYSTPVSQFLKKSRSIFIESSRSTDTRKHDQEAQRVRQIVDELKRVLGKNFDSKAVGIITPWRVQVVNIRKTLGSEFSEISVDTVERYQGSQRKIIILSLAVNNSYQLRGLQSLNLEKSLDRKLLVALSRAEEQLIILGHAPVLQQSPFYNEVLQKIKRDGLYLHEAEANMVLPAAEEAERGLEHIWELEGV